MGGPALESADGRREWWVNGEKHRVDGPAVTHPDGTMIWYQKGKLHREDGPAVTHLDGTMIWYQKGKLHREDGPAVTHLDGTMIWYQNGLLHREDGPAIIKADGTEQWWVEGVAMTQEEFTNRQSGTDGLTESDISKILSSVDEDSRKATRFHLEMVNKTTGEILMKDVEYCLDLSDRVRKYAQKTGAKHWTPERGL